MSDGTWVLGVAASHNGAACLIKDSEIVVAVQEERVTREKRAFIEGHEDSFAIRYCFDYAGISPSALAAVGVCSPLGSAYTDLAKNRFLELDRHRVPLFSVPHHLGHAIAGFATSGFSEAAVLVIDGMGSPWEDLPDEERATALRPPADHEAALTHEHASLYQASGTALSPLEKHLGPVGAIVKWFQDNPAFGVPPYASLGGIFNSAAVQIFGQFHEAGKVMGLAPYAKPEIPIHDFYEIEGGTFRFNPAALKRYEGRGLLKNSEGEAAILAASAQAAVESGVLRLVRRLRKLSPSRNLVYAGGVALNGIANERIVREGGFDEIYFMPAAEDSGTCFGAAYHAAWQLGAEHRPRRLERDAMGRPYELTEIDQAIARTPSITRLVAPDFTEAIVDLLCSGKIIGWFEGGSELGPRALGQRSILCDPRPSAMKDHLNARVKFREAFRPFAPLVLLEEASSWFEVGGEIPAESPFMLRITNFRDDKRHLVPSVVHVDGTGRLQTISAEASPRLYEVIRRFCAKTGVPMLLNTSFNVAGEPIVETPDDALWCLLYTGVDYCALEGRIVGKKLGYRSILDLLVRPGKISKLEPRGDLAELRVETRYGSRTEIIDAEALGLIESITGGITGSELLTRLNGANVAPKWDATRLLRRLGAMRRASLLEFEEPGK